MYQNECVLQQQKLVITKIPPGKRSYTNIREYNKKSIWNTHFLWTTLVANNSIKQRDVL